MKTQIFILMCCITCIFSDECNYYATLIESDSFYLTEPFTKELHVNISTYDTVFTQLPDKIRNFQSILESHDSEEELNELEPLSLTPYDEEFNALKINDSVPGYMAQSECSKIGGTLIHLTPQNKEKIIQIMKSLGITKTPFKALPFYSLYSFPQLEQIDSKLTLDQMYSVWAKSPPSITTDNKIEYPSLYKPYTTAKPVLTTVRAEPDSLIPTNPDDYVSNVLCFKPNNPWDLPDNRHKWLLMIPKLKTAIRILNSLKSAFDSTKNVFNHLPGKTKENVIEIFKLVLPDSLTSVINFLEKFSNKHSWSSSTTKAFSTFNDFIKNTLEVSKLFNYQTNTFTKIHQHAPQFRPLALDDDQWSTVLGIDSEKYGIAKPVNIKITTALEDNAFQARVSLRIFNRINSKITIYKVHPNIVNKRIVTPLSLIQSSKKSLVVADSTKPSDCVDPSNEAHRVCNTLTSRLDMNYLMSSRCGEALLSKGQNANFSYCPTQSVLTGLQQSVLMEPTFIRASCDDHNSSTVVINSVDPVTLSFVCDSVEADSIDLSSFPTYIKTDCEVRLVGNGNSKTVLPQLNDDLHQDPTVQILYSPPGSPQGTTTMIYLIITISLTIFIVVLTCLSAILCSIRIRIKVETPDNISIARRRELKVTNDYPLLSK